MWRCRPKVSSFQGMWAVDSGRDCVRLALKWQRMIVGKKRSNKRKSEWRRWDENENVNHWVSGHKSFHVEYGKRLNKIR